MAGVSYLCALALAGVFAWAGAAKLRSTATTAGTFAALGLPGPAVLARVVPAVELALAVALVTVPAAGATVSLAILAGFSVVLARSLRAGDTVSCGCFGTATDEPVSSLELARNAVLGLLAVVALLATGPVRPGLDDVVLVSTAGVVAMIGLALVRLRRDVGAVWDNTLPGELVSADR